MSSQLPFRQALNSLAVRNYRLYFIGQVGSISGNWMQQIAIAWLVLKLTGSAFDLGVTAALQNAPYLVVGFWGGLIADRVPKRRLLIATQIGQVVPPILLWALTDSGAVRIWMVYLLVICRGFINTVDNPARQSFVAELVGTERIVNAVSLNASITQAGRLIGPAIASVIIATTGLGTCFLLNGLSFVLMVVMLLAMRADQLIPSPPAARGRGQLRAALSLVRQTTELRIPLVLMLAVGLLAFNFPVVLPAVARFTFHGNATTYALMTTFLAMGALAGAIVSSIRTVITPRLVAIAAIVFGAALGVAAAADTLAVELVVLTVVGAASVTFSASVQASLQLAAAPDMRGRILALYQLVYQGTTPLGALAVGALAATAGARSGFLLGMAGALIAGCYGLWATRTARTPTPRDAALQDAISDL